MSYSCDNDIQVRPQRHRRPPTLRVSIRLWTRLITVIPNHRSKQIASDSSAIIQCNRLSISRLCHRHQESDKRMTSLVMRAMTATKRLWARVKRISRSLCVWHLWSATYAAAPGSSQARRAGPSWMPHTSASWRFQPSASAIWCRAEQCCRRLKTVRWRSPSALSICSSEWLCWRCLSIWSKKRSRLLFGLSVRESVFWSAMTTTTTSDTWGLLFVSCIPMFC